MAKLLFQASVLTQNLCILNNCLRAKFKSLAGRRPKNVHIPDTTD